MQMELTKQAVVSYVQEYCRTRKTGPSAGQILRRFEQRTPARLYELFPEGKAEIYAAAGIPLSDRDRRMMKQTEKASLKKQLIIEKRRKAAGEVEKPPGREVKPEQVSPEEVGAREAEEREREAVRRLEAERRRREAEEKHARVEAILDAKKIPAYLRLVERVSPTAEAFLKLCKRVGRDPGTVCAVLVKEGHSFDEWRTVTKRNEDFDVYLEELLSGWVHSCRIELSKRKRKASSYSPQCGLCNQRYEYNPERLEYERVTYLPNSRLHCPSCEPDGSRWHSYPCPVCKEVDGHGDPMEYAPSLNVLECSACGYMGRVKGTPLKPLGTAKRLRALEESRLKDGVEKLRAELKGLEDKVRGKDEELSRLNHLFDAKRSRVQELGREIDVLEARRSNLEASVKAEYAEKAKPFQEGLRVLQERLVAARRGVEVVEKRLEEARGAERLLTPILVGRMVTEALAEALPPEEGVKLNGLISGYNQYLTEKIDLQKVDYAKLGERVKRILGDRLGFTGRIEELSRQLAGKWASEVLAEKRLKVLEAYETLVYVAHLMGKPPPRLLDRSGRAVTALDILKDDT